MVFMVAAVVSGGLAEDDGRGIIAEQRVLHRARPPAVQPIQPRRRRDLGAQFPFDVDQGSRPQNPVVPGERAERFLHEAAAERRVEKHDVVRGVRVADEPARVGFDDAHGFRAEAGDFVFDLAADPAVVLDQGRRPRAARDRLEAEDAAAGEQVEARCAFDVRCEPVEQGFAHAVRRGADAGQIEKFEIAALPPSADDAQLGARFGTSGCGAAGRGRAAHGRAESDSAGPPTMTVTSLPGFRYLR